MSTLHGGIIQTGLKSSTDISPEVIRQAMIESHIPYSRYGHGYRARDQK